MKRVFAHIGFPFALSMLVLNILPVQYAAVVFGVILACLMFSLAFKKIRRAVAVPLSLAAAAAACIVFMTVMYSSVLPAQKLDKVQADVRMCVTDFARDNGSSYSYTAKTDFIDINGSVQNIKVNFKTKSKLKCDLYDSFECNVMFYQTGSNAFSSYGCYADGIYLTAVEQNGIYNITPCKNKPPMYYILMLRSKIENILMSALRSDTAALSCALMTGDKSNLSDKIRNDFKDCGVSHLMAVSGLHLTVIAGTVYILLKKLRIGNNACAFVTLAVMLVYDGIAAFSPSVIRASVMMGVMLIGTVFKRKADALNSLGLAVFIMCVNPFTVSDVGALLSVTSVLSLITLSPLLLSKYKPENRIIKYIYSSLCTSISVIIYTFPIIWILYRSVTLTSIILNIFMIPVAEVSMISALGLLLFSHIPAVGYVFAVITSFTANILIKAAGFFSSMSFLTFDISSSLTGIAISAVMITAAVTIMFDNKKLFRLFAVISMFIFAFTVVLGNYTAGGYDYIRVSDSAYAPSVMLYNSDYAVIIGNINSSDYYSYKNICTRKNIDISLMVSPDSSNTYYNELLTRDIKTECFVLPDDNGDASIQSDCGHIQFLKSFKMNLTDSVNMQYNLTDGGYYFVIKIDGYTVVINDTKSSISENADIIIDFSGCRLYETAQWKVSAAAESEKGSITFKLKDGRQIAAERESIWQK